MSDARILDRGYRRFDGQRRGVPGAIRSVAWQSARSVLGLGRKARHKIAPSIVIVIAYLPAIFFVGLSAFFGADIFDEFIPEFWELPAYGLTTVAVVLFAGLVAPEALVRDRRDGMLSLYLATPLTRVTYLISKITAVVGILALIVVGPTLMFLLAVTFAGSGPEGLGEWATVLVRIIVSGIAASVVFSLVAMACSCLTDRRAFASIAVILLLLGFSITISILIEAADASVNWLLLDPVGMPFELIARIFGAEGFETRLSAANVYLANLGWVGVSLAVIWQRYRKAGA